jgi:hypothetical protein
MIQFKVGPHGVGTLLGPNKNFCGCRLGRYGRLCGQPASVKVNWNRPHDPVDYFCMDCWDRGARLDGDPTVAELRRREQEQST